MTSLAGKFKSLTIFNKLLVVAGVAIFGLSATSLAGSPVVETKTEIRTEEITPNVIEEKDPELLVGERKTKTKGVSGEQKVKYRVTYTDGKETKKEVQGKPQIIKLAIDEVVLVGTREVVSETVNEVIPFAKVTEPNAGMDKGSTALKQSGVNGQKTLTYEVTRVDGKEVGRKLIKELVATNPVNEITYIGTKTKQVARTQSNCDPNYSGACVPISSDVDCGGGSGNGPAYVYGTVRVIGADIYDLDRDGNGYGCE
jgi:resuscitation-promoting factor RpfB